MHNAELRGERQLEALLCIQLVSGFRPCKGPVYLTFSFCCKGTEISVHFTAVIRKPLFNVSLSYAEVHHTPVRGAHTVGATEFAAMTNGAGRRRSSAGGGGGGGGSASGGSAYMSSSAYFGSHQPSSGHGSGIYP